MRAGRGFCATLLVEVEMVVVDDAVIVMVVGVAAATLVSGGSSVVAGGSVVVGAGITAGATVVVDSVAATEVVDSSVAVIVISSVAAQPVSTIDEASKGNQRLSPRFRCRRTALIPLKPMSRRLLVVGSLLVMGLAACGGGTPTSESDAQFILSQDFPLPTVEPESPRLPTITTGADGIVVEVTDSSRIIVLNEAIAEIVVSLGMQDFIIGRDATTTLASLADVEEVSNGHDISAESVLSLRPSVVIGDTRTGPPEALQQLRAAGVAVLVAPEVWTLSDLPSRVEMIAGALGIPRAGDRLVDLTQRAIDDALRGVGAYADVLRVAFLYVRGTASVYLLGGTGSGADELVAATGAVDVGALNGLSAFTPLTAEAIVQADPDVLLVMTRGLDSVGGIDGLLALPGVSSTRAAATRAVIAVDDDLLLSFGPRTGALIARLAELLNTFSSDA
ncbi:MAG: heme/hemin ABC transporter substrate-binding protein [Ilumatobacteraceae bacterium]